MQEGVFSNAVASLHPDTLAREQINKHSRCGNCDGLLGPKDQTHHIRVAVVKITSNDTSKDILN
jgi:hypothetical protein